MLPAPDPPRDEYQKRRSQWLAEEEALAIHFVRIGNWRLLVGCLFVLLAVLAVGRSLFSAWWLLAPVAAFVPLVIWHRRVIARRNFAQRAIRYYDRGLARLDDNWHSGGETGERFRDAAHIYTDDLDVFGKGSLFQFLNVARTAAGEDSLAGWLSQPAGFETAFARQQAVQELRGKLDLREEVALLGEEVRSGLRSAGIAEWGEQAPIEFPATLRPLALAMSLLSIVSGLAVLAHLIALWPFLLSLACNGLLLYLYRTQIAAILSKVDAAASDLALLAHLIARIERERFETPLLQEFLAKLAVHGVPAARRIRTLGRWIDIMPVSSHPVIRAVRLLILWDAQVAFGIEAWRRISGPHLAQWIQAIADFEALSSLASLTYERPAWVFPGLSASSEAVFQAVALCHPLIPVSQAVPNDVVLSPGQRLLVVSGSNMSGKSTLLRAIGLNSVLAWAGAPVAATSLQLTRLLTGASLRISDSLQDHRSRFFAEITRLRDIVALSKGPCPVLFLLDELLSGTNSHDRRLGAAALVRGLLRGHSIGLITTHDLALTEIETDLAKIVTNVHFEDQIVSGQVRFDYRLRPGIVTHSNALELMRLVGLDV